MNHPSSSDLHLTADQVSKLVANTEPWLSCDGCFEEIDVAVEALLYGAYFLTEPLRVHLARCAVCHDEAETLITLAAHDRGADSDALLDTFRDLVHGAE